MNTNLQFALETTEFSSSTTESYLLQEKLKELIKSERQITNEILELLNQAMEKRAYLELGYSSLFDWLTKGFGYSNAAAYRRIEAARLIKSIPEVSKKLETGKVNLSTLCKVQSIVKTKEKLSGQKVAVDTKKGLIQKIENKSLEETERILLQTFPETCSQIHQERKLVINEEITRHTLNFTKEMSENLKRAKEILSHRLPDQKDADVIGYVLEFFLQKQDPLRKRVLKEKVEVLNSKFKGQPSRTTGASAIIKKDEVSVEPDLYVEHRRELKEKKVNAIKTAKEVKTVKTIKAAIAFKEKSMKASYETNGKSEKVSGKTSCKTSSEAGAKLGNKPSHKIAYEIGGESSSGLNTDITSVAEAMCVELFPEADVDVHSNERLIKEGRRTTDRKTSKLNRSLKNKILEKFGGKCSFKDPRTGRVCQSTYQVQIDHIHPKVLGGTDHPENLRVLCRQHNLLAAERMLGNELINRFRRV